MGNPPSLKPKAAGPMGLPRQVRTTGPMGPLRGRHEKKSDFLAWPAMGIHKETLCAKIYFDTNKDQLTGDDFPVVDDVGTILRHLQQVSDLELCTCKGYADVRHEPGYNRDLSERRAKAVASRLRKWLPTSCASQIKLDPRGESQSRPDPSFWAEDRRVEILVKCHPARLQRPSVAFETAKDDKTEDNFVHDLERMEIDAKGVVKAWRRDEIESGHQEWVYEAKHIRERFSQHTRGRFSREVKKLCAMTLDEYIERSRSLVTAYVHVKHEVVASRNMHRVSGTVFDAATRVSMFNQESVLAQVLLDTRGTDYLSSPEDNPQQVWRRLAPGQTAPPGVPTRTHSTSPVGLFARPGDLYKKLCAGFPSITARVADALKRP